MLRKKRHFLKDLWAKLFAVPVYPSDPARLLDMEAYNAGAVAYPRDINPYDKGTQQHWSYEVGNRDADEQSRFVM